MHSAHLLDLDFDALTDILKERGLAAYRAQQIWKAVLGELVSTYGDITTLPKSLRDFLALDLPLDTPEIVSTQRSTDQRTQKMLLRLDDGETVETVAMIYDDRATVCISTQVGCSVGCALCATGAGGFRRDLYAGEIIAQVLAAARAFRADGRTLTNVVYMGMGEPLLNPEASIQSLRVLNDPRGLGLGARSFTVSTVGIVPGIDRLSEVGIQFNLAVSLHAADDELRSRLVPINRTYPIDALLAACRRYIARTHRRITFEITLIDGVNDRPGDAKAVSRRLSGMLCHVNLIPFNPFPGCPWTASPRERVEQYESIIAQSGLPVSIRYSRGVEIQAGCGQLHRRSSP